ncbi:MAG: hypothetical protein V5804_00375 [Mucilaginibacter sp.]|uniref:hypothetical protein n=1 Tax=Mucilaginibacter sp. TaxID=1882438 RepID=UPI0034E45F48
MDIFEKKLEELLIHKPFEKLVDGEKKYVLQHVTQEEYQKYHLLLSQAIASFTNGPVIAPDAIIKQNLKNTFRSTHNKPVVKFQFYNFKLPSFFYTPVLRGAFLLVFFMFIIWSLFNFSKQVKPINIVKSEVADKEIIDLNKFNKAQQATKINAITLPLIRNLNLRAIASKHKRNVKFNKALPKISNTKNEDPLCLKVQVEPVGLNLKIEEYTIPCLSTNISQRDSTIQAAR